MTEAAGPSAAGSSAQWISYEEFGSRFFRRAVTGARIEKALEEVAGKHIKIGPVDIGLVGVNAEGRVGDPTISATKDSDVVFRIQIPVALGIVARVGSEMKLHAGIEITLELRARPAEPLLIVVDIPQITADDVRLKIEAGALGLTGRLMLDPILGPLTVFLRGEVANQVNLMLSKPESIESRITDVGAAIDDTEPKFPSRLKFMSYEEFGKRFIAKAVTVEKLVEGMADMEGDTIDIEPMKAGPKDMATVSASGVIRKPSVKAKSGSTPAFDLNIPIDLDLNIAMGKDNKYQAKIDIPLVLTPRGADPLLLVLDVPAPATDDITVDLVAQGFRAKMLGAVGGIKAQLQQQVAESVAERVADQSGRTFDIGERVDNA